MTTISLMLLLAVYEAPLDRQFFTKFIYFIGEIIFRTRFKCVEESSASRPK